ncbi:MAG TPA: hypothetical protein VKE41_06585 [Roseiflexaceae bacterium]|nr:hypothetical protein [Roseiflexaceae bacterium]
MLDHLPEEQRASPSAPGARRGIGSGLWLVLWALWTLAVAIAGYLGWRADILAGRPYNLLGMAIDAVMVGIIGLIVLTVIEIRIEARR